MAQGHHANPQGRGHGGAAYAPAGEQTSTRSSRPCGCGCGCGCSDGGKTSTCCTTECFERPRYFCGHLLTDTDLSLEQRYVVNKHKLYHRALDGYGIVCGLRLTCHHDCPGWVMIGEGFAIDDCGNDLVVCEPTPFDVIGTLRQKNLLYSPHATHQHGNHGAHGKPGNHDPCTPGKSDDGCVIPQCYYVVACYDEEPAEYVTPLTPACGPSPRECEATRIRETVRFDIVDKLPKTPDPLADLDARIRHCFALFTDGPFADMLKKPIASEALAGKANVERHEEWHNLICGLRILFKRHLERCPDHYNCTLEKDLDDITCPPPPQNYSPSQTHSPSQTYGADIRNAVCRIVELAYSYVMACVMGELAFPCPAPSQACCVVLGTVEVENDRLIRVCNCPRSYVWSSGSFWQVLMATLFGSSACKADERAAKDKDAADDYAARHRRCGCGSTLGDRPCCQEITPKDGCETFVRTLAAGGRATPDLATGMLDAIDWIRCSMQHVFDPTRTDPLVLRAFRGQPFADVSRSLAGKARIVERAAPVSCEPWGLIDALDMAGHVTADDRLLFLTENGLIVDVVKQGVQDRLTVTESTVDDVQQELQTLKNELEEIKKRLSQNVPGPGGTPGDTRGGRGTTRRGPRGSSGGGAQS